MYEVVCIVYGCIYNVLYERVVAFLCFSRVSTSAESLVHTQAAEIPRQLASDCRPTASNVQRQAMHARAADMRAPGTPRSNYVFFFMALFVLLEIDHLHAPHACAR